MVCDLKLGGGGRFGHGSRPCESVACMHVSMAKNSWHEKPHSTSGIGLQEADKEKKQVRQQEAPQLRRARVGGCSAWCVPGRIAYTAAQHSGKSEYPCRRPFSVDEPLDGGGVGLRQKPVFPPPRARYCVMQFPTNIPRQAIRSRIKSSKH